MDPLGKQGQLNPLGERTLKSVQGCKGPKKHISISILWGYPCLIGLLYKGVYMGYPYPSFCLCAF